MNKSCLFAAAAAAVLVSACGMGAPSYPDFEGASYRIEGVAAAPDGAGTIPTVIYRDGPKMRVETVLPDRGPATIVYDQGAGAAYVLAEAPTAPATVTTSTTTTTGATTTIAPSPTGAPAASTTPAAPPNPNAAGAVTATPAAPTGVAIKLDNAQAPQAMETAWAALGENGARPVGDCEVAGESGHEWRPAEDTGGVERTACITADGIVLRLREDQRVLFEAVSLQRGAQDARLFGVPAGYQVVDPAAVVETVGETMEEMSSATSP